MITAHPLCNAMCHRRTLGHAQSSFPNFQAPNLSYGQCDSVAFHHHPDPDLLSLGARGEYKTFVCFLGV